MKSKLSILTLFLALTLMSGDVKAQCPCFVSTQACASGTFTPCNKTITVAPGSVYKEKVIANLPQGNTSYCVKYSSGNLPASFSQFHYFPVTAAFGSNTSGYPPANIGGGPFNISSSSQTITVAFDLTNFIPSPLSWNCHQVVRVDLSFKGVFGSDLGMLTFYLNVVRHHSLYSLDVKNSEAFYIGNDGRIYSEKWNGSAWVNSAINPANGGWTSSTAFGWLAASPTADHVFFAGIGGKLFNIHKVGGSWNIGPLSSSVTNFKGFIRLKGSRVYYVGSDNQIYYFTWSNNAWVHNAINPLNGWANALVSGAMDVSQVNDELFYRSGAQGAVYRLHQNSSGQWAYEILLASGCASNIIVDPQTNTVYFKGIDSKIHRLIKTSTVWQHEVLNAANVDYQVQGYLTKFPGDDRVFYIGIDDLMHNLYLNGSVWSDFPLSYSVNQIASNAFAAEGHVFYLNGDSRIHTFDWGGSNWLDGPMPMPPNAKKCW